MSLRRLCLPVALALISSLAGFVFVVVGGEDGNSSALAAEEVFVPRGPEVAFCPTAEQVRIHAERYGFDYKPTVDCLSGAGMPDPSPQDVPVEDPSGVKSFSEAQRVLDPEDRLDVIITKDARTGEFGAALLQMPSSALSEVKEHQWIVIDEDGKAVDR